MATKIFLLWLLACFAGAPPTSAQEVGYLDMTRAAVGRRIHQPTTGSGGGFGAGYGDAAARDRAEVHALRISLLSLGSEKYRVGEDLVYEMKAENTGHEPLLIPWDPNLADMEPAPATTAYEYRVADIVLWLSDADREIEVSQSNSLYGTSKNPRSFVRVGPGEWVRVRASVRLSALDATASFERTILVRVIWTTSNARVTPSKDGYREDSQAEGPLNISVNTAHFELLGPAQRP